MQPELNTPDPANQVIKAYLKTTWYVSWSRVGTKLCRAAALQELSLTPLTYSMNESSFTISNEYTSNQRRTVVKYFYSALKVLFKCLYFISVFL